MLSDKTLSSNPAIKDWSPSLCLSSICLTHSRDMDRAHPPQEPKRDTDSSDRGLEVIFPLLLFFAFILPHQKGQSCTATTFRGMTGYSDTLNVHHKLFFSVSNMMHPWYDQIWTCRSDCRFHRRLACSVFLTSGIKICFPSAALCLDQRFDSAFLKSDRRGPACQDRNLRAEARNGLRSASQQHWNHVSQVKAARPRHNGLGGNELTIRISRTQTPECTVKVQNQDKSQRCLT